ncbi:hypothetical protein [Pseudofrankia sp. DC12]|uniref:hypothetical protein n=1 Tax=Pseudofrankia sp. DC12 TaxID=683315 RepID=UPI0018DE1B44|nr:hypothetical protein [Pseudofrankia sp. DC12]
MGRRHRGDEPQLGEYRERPPADEHADVPGATAGRPAAWPAIRDGGGIDTPLYGVVEWKGGAELPTQCRFAGRYRTDRALGGQRSNSRPNLLNDRSPHLIFAPADAWGYCDGAEPVIVLPVQRQIHYQARTVPVPAGVVIVRLALRRTTQARGWCAGSWSGRGPEGAASQDGT